jgi:hypothetical protein
LPRIIRKKIRRLAGFSNRFAPFNVGVKEMRLALVVITALLQLQDAGVQVPAKVLEDYAGTYQTGPLWLVFTVEDGHLTSQFPGSPKFPLPARSETRFIIPGANADIEFVRDGKGAVTHLLLHQNGTHQIIKRVPERKQIAVPQQVLQTYAGRYDLPRPGFGFLITVDGSGQLIAESIGQFKYPMFAESETSFFFKNVNAQIEFRKNAEGRVTALVLHRDSVEETADRK